MTRTDDVDEALEPQKSTPTAIEMFWCEACGHSASSDQFKPSYLRGSYKVCPNCFESFRAFARTKYDWYHYPLLLYINNNFLHMLLFRVFMFLVGLGIMKVVL